jgi:type I restriction enzyme S subunit
MSELYELPDGWEWKKLGELTEVNIGKTPTRSKKEYFLGDKVWLSIRDLKGDYVSTSKEGLTDKAILDSNIKIVPKGTLLMSFKLTLGRTAFANCNLYTNEAIASLPVKDEKILDKYFLKYSIGVIDLEKEVDNAVKGKTINKQKIKNLDIPLPPLQEQKRIVAKLDSLFEKIDAAIALHQQNIDEAEKFMGSVLDEVFGELEEKYEIEKIGNIIDVLTDYHSNGAYKTLKANVELLDNIDYALMIRATDLEDENYIDNVKYITEDAYNFMSKSKVYGGEIILPKIGSIGNVYFMPYLKRPISLAMNLFMLRCSNHVINKYLYLYLKSPKGYESIITRANGAVTKTITKDAVKSIKLPLPPLQIQQKTVTYLDQISQKTEQLKKVQQEKLKNLKELKASILDRAFRGEL